MMRTSRITHPLNITYLVVGLVFLGIAGSWALRSADVLDTRQVGWLLPLLLVGAGAVGLVAGAVRGLGRDSHGDPHEEPEDVVHDPGYDSTRSVEDEDRGHSA